VNRIVTSILLATLILFLKPICFAENLTLANDDIIKYDNSPQPKTERGNQSNNERREGETIIYKAPQTRVAESSKDVSASDKSIIVKRCKKAWNLFRSAFSRGDIEDALKYVSSRSKDDFREFIETEIGSTVLGDITTAEVIEPSIARFAMRSRDKLRPGDDIVPGHSVGDFIPYDGYVVFTKNSDGKWLVDFF